MNVNERKILEDAIKWRKMKRFWFVFAEIISLLTLTGLVFLAIATVFLKARGVI